MGITKITRNYQITIPKDIRELKDFKKIPNLKTKAPY